MSEVAITPEAVVEETIEQIGARIFAEDKPVTPAVAPVEPVAEVPKDPVAERASARILANERAERRAAKVRADIAAERLAVEAERAKVGEDAKLAELVKAAKGSPSKVLELLGYEPKTFLETLATEHEPEAIARRVVEGTQTEVQKLQARIDAMEKADAERRRAADEAASDREHQEAGNGFVEFVAANAEKYPALVETMTPKEFVEAGFRLLHAPYKDSSGQIVKDANGRTVRVVDQYMADNDGAVPSDHEIAEALEAQATPRAQARSEWRTRIGKNAPAASTATSTGDVRATQMDRGPSPRTLTSRAASERAAAPPSKELSQEEKDAECIRIINAAMNAS